MQFKLFSLLFNVCMLLTKGEMLPLAKKNKFAEFELFSPREAVLNVV